MIRRSLASSILVALSLVASSALAQDPGVDEVTLKNGGSIRGTVISSEPGTSVKILEMGSKEPRVIPWAQVGDVEKGKYAPKSAVQPGSAGPGYGSAIPDEPLAPPPPPPLKLGAPGIVKLHIDSPEPMQLLENTGTSFVAAGGYGMVINQFRPVCTAPCDMIIDGRKGQQFGIVGNFPTPKPVSFLDQRGEVKLTVNPGSVAARILGWVGIGLGAGAVGAGAALVALSSVPDGSGGSSGSKAAGIGVLAGGGALIVGGIIGIALSGTSWKLEPAAPAAAGKSARRPRYWMGEF